MKKSIFLVLLLASFVSVSFPAATGDINRVVVGGTTGGNIFVRDYEILTSGKWNRLRDLSFPARGAVGTIAASAPKNNLQFSIYYTYQEGASIKAANVLLDYQNFSVVKDTPVKGTFGSFSVGGSIIRMNTSNPYRMYSVDTDHDVVSQKTRPATGNPFGAKTTIYSNDTDIVFAHSTDWWGSHAAQILLNPGSGDFFGDFRSLTPSGKPANDVKRYRFTNDVVNISLGLRYDKNDRNDFDSYVVGVRDIKQSGANFQTAVSLTLFDYANHTPVDSRLVYNFRNISAGPLSNAAGLNSIAIYDAPDEDDPANSRSWILYGYPKGGKLLTYVQQFDPFDLRRIQQQVLIGKGDLDRWNANQFYGLYAVGFQYYDDDDWRKLQ